MSVPAGMVRLDKTPLSVEMRGVTLDFGPKLILDDFSLSVPPGAKISLLGENSSGKSTILKVMVGLVPPAGGEVLLFGRPLAKATSGEKSRLRRRVGMQFQAGAMFDSMTVLDNLRLAGRECSRGRGVKPAGKEEILHILDQVGLGHAARLSPSELSGGMRKRAALARALIARPELALFDEPTAGLDPVTSSRIINLLAHLAAREKAAMILATSDIDVAGRFSDDLILFRRGRIVARGGVDDLTASPEPYVVKFFSRRRLVGSAAAAAAGA
ncbi:MAG: ATP-binding cassette domain-containing protein [Deltaproteobacteria bacterium]|nr:ATP-binding cassette domain-containing protein [Deltaproteobacteria bacterium]